MPGGPCPRSPGCCVTAAGSASCGTPGTAAYPGWPSSTRWPASHERRTGHRTVAPGPRRQVEFPPGTPMSPVEERVVEYSLPVTSEQLFGLLGTYSGVITLDPGQRADFSRRVRAFLDRQPWDQVDLPMICRCLRGTRQARLTVTSVGPIDQPVVDLLFHEVGYARMLADKGTVVRGLHDQGPDRNERDNGGGTHLPGRRRGSPTKSPGPRSAMTCSCPSSSRQISSSPENRHGLAGRLALVHERSADCKRLYMCCRFKGPAARWGEDAPEVDGPYIAGRQRAIEGPFDIESRHLLPRCLPRSYSQSRTSPWSVSSADISVLIPGPPSSRAAQSEIAVVARS